jgi:hypothetical protein
LEDPTIEVRDGNGVLAAQNDDWKTNQMQVEATGLAPTHDREAALVAKLLSGNYTGILRGKTGATGVGLIEVYHLQ